MSIATSLNDLLTGQSNKDVKTEKADDSADQEKKKENHCILHGINIKPLKFKEDLTPLWLSLFLNRRIAEEGFELEPIGTGQMSSTFRVKFHEVDQADSPETVAVKFASDDESTRDLGIRFAHYLREAVFYRRFGDLLSAGLPRCYGAVVDSEGWFTMVLEDLGAQGAYVTGQLEGSDYEHAALALKSLARMQAQVLGDPKLDEDEWLNQKSALNQKLYNDCLPVLLERYPPDPEHDRLIRWLGENNNLDRWLATRKPPFCIFHGDFRLDNILFLEKDHKRAIAVDWGGSEWASPLRDAAYFLGNGLKIEDRRAWEKDLLKEYLAELNRLSKVKLSWDHAWEEYRRQSIYGLSQHIPAAGILPDTERGKIMFKTLISRQAQHAVDMDAMSLVDPDLISLEPDISQEGVHIPPEDSGPLFNESWYFDATTPDGEVGMYARVGRLPNQNVCSFVGGIFRRNEAPILFVDMQAPLPDADPLIQEFSTDRFSVEIKCLDPLAKFSFKLKGKGSRFDDPSGPLKGEHGVDVPDCEIEGTWFTVGSAYKKRKQSRYEIPCRVNGNIKIGDQNFTLNAAAGERNHSWGVRNWWAADWVWSGLHFEDGTNIFTIALGRNSNSTGGSGFIQKGGKLTEITKVINEFGFLENGLPGKLKLHIEPGPVTIECETISAAGLRLMDPEGREAHLPRVMCTAQKTGDVKGVGWLDFNRVIAKDPPASLVDKFNPLYV